MCLLCPQGSARALWVKNNNKKTPDLIPHLIESSWGKEHILNRHPQITTCVKFYKREVQEVKGDDAGVRDTHSRGSRCQWAQGTTTEEAMFTLRLKTCRR